MTEATVIRIAALRQHAKAEIAAALANESRGADVQEHAREALAALLRARELEDEAV